MSRIFRCAVLLGLLAASAGGCTPKEPPQTAQLTPALVRPLARPVVRPLPRTAGRAAFRHHRERVSRHGTARHRTEPGPRAEEKPRAEQTPRGDQPLDLRLRRD